MFLAAYFGNDCAWAQKNCAKLLVRLSIGLSA